METKSQSDAETSHQSDEAEIHSFICPTREAQHQSHTQFKQPLPAFILEKEAAAETETETSLTAKS